MKSIIALILTNIRNTDMFKITEASEDKKPGNDWSTVAFLGPVTDYFISQL